MSTDPVERLIERLTIVFGEPRTPNPVLYIEEIAKAVKPYSAEILEQAGDDVIRANTFWPKPGEIVEKAEGIAARIASRNRKPEVREEWPEPTDEQRRRATELVERAKRSMLNAGPVDEPVALPSVDREAFEAMQRNSPNDFHRVGLTDRSRAMSGERD